MGPAQESLLPPPTLGCRARRSLAPHFLVPSFCLGSRQRHPLTPPPQDCAACRGEQRGAEQRAGRAGCSGRPPSLRAARGSAVQSLPASPMDSAHLLVIISDQNSGRTEPARPVRCVSASAKPSRDVLFVCSGPPGPAGDGEPPGPRRSPPGLVPLTAACASTASASAGQPRKEVS